MDGSLYHLNNPFVKYRLRNALLGIVAVVSIATINSCQADSKKEEKTDTCYYIILARPDDAVVTMNGIECDSLEVAPNSVVKWSVSLKGYEKKQGIDTVKVAKNSVHKVSLKKVKKAKPVNPAVTTSNRQTDLKKLLIILICVAIVLVLLMGCLLIFLMRKRKETNSAMESNALSPTTTDLQDVKNPSLPEVPALKPKDDIESETNAPTPSEKTDGARQGNNKFAILTQEWEVVGASVQGNGHKSSGLPCQDSCAYEYLGEGWGIAMTSDGAGSAEHSDIGSKITIARTMHYLKHLLEEERWIEKKELPTDNTWMRLVVPELRKVRDDIYGFSVKNNIEYKSLSATLIVVIHSPYGLLVAHVGDGRAGCRDKEGVWHSIITPHKGEEANQTVFLTSGFWDPPSFILSGVMVPETRVIRQPVSAFTLMSDGCENTAWLFNQKDENTGHYYDPNKPFPKFFDPLIISLNNESRDGAPEEDIESNWSSFIEEGTRGFVAESDDKTMILGFTRE